MQVSNKIPIELGKDYEVSWTYNAAEGGRLTAQCGDHDHDRDRERTLWGTEKEKEKEKEEEKEEEEEDVAAAAPYAGPLVDWRSKSPLPTVRLYEVVYTQDGGRHHSKFDGNVGIISIVD